jgi:hypothetical protein
MAINRLRKISPNKWVIAILLIASLIYPKTSLARPDIVLSTLEIDIWPEYDRPDVLVIYQIYLPSDTPLPAVLSFRIPASVKSEIDVAARDVDGLLYKVPYTEQLDITWKKITLTTFSPEARLEYYDPELKRDGYFRHFSYTWLGDYAVDNLIIQVQEPRGATDVTIVPELGAGQKGESGLLHHTASLGKIPDNRLLRVTLDYQRSTDELSVEGLAVRPSGPLSTSTTGRITVNDLMPAILGFLAVIISLVILWWYQLTKQRNRMRDFINSRDGKIQFEQSTSKQGTIFCYNCGKESLPGDMYCRICGTRLRIEKPTK